MSELLGFGQLLVLVWLGFSLLIALVLSPSLDRVILPRLARMPAGRRSQWLWAISGAPLWGGLVLCGLCLLPSALSFAWPLLDHCLNHNHHVHLCLIHGKDAPFKAMWLLPPVVGLLVVIGRVAPWVWRHARAWVMLRNLERTATFDVQTGTHLLDVDTPLAFVGGLSHQRIFMSRGLHDQLSSSELALVLAHERAHVRRRDNSRRITAALMSFLHLPHARLRLLDELELACEQACDIVATTSELERLHLAKTLLHLNHLISDVPTPRVFATSGAMGHLEARIHALLDAPQTETSPHRTSFWWPVSVVALLCLLTDPLHHLTETLLGLLLG